MILWVKFRSKSSVLRKYINKRNYRIDGKPETAKAFEEIKNLIQNILGIEIKGAV